MANDIPSELREGDVITISLINGMLAAIRRNTLLQSSTVNVSRGAAGTSVELARNAAAQGDTLPTPEDHPFKLLFDVNYHFDQEGKAEARFVKYIHIPPDSCFYNETECAYGNPVKADGVTDYFKILDEDAKAPVENEQDIVDVYAHVVAISGGFVLYVTNSKSELSKLGDELACVKIGSYEDKVVDNKTTEVKVKEQIVKDRMMLSETGLFPWKLKTLMTSGRCLIHVPGGVVTVNDKVGNIDKRGGMTPYDVKGYDDWYDLGENVEHVWLHVRADINSSGSYSWTSSVMFYVDGNETPLSEYRTQTIGNTKRKAWNIEVGTCGIEFGEYVVLTQLLKNNLTFTLTEDGEGGLVDVGSVKVIDNRTRKELDGVVGYRGYDDRTKETFLVVNDGLGADMVVIGDPKTEVTATLLDYLTGTEVGELGKNLHTANFDEECLEQQGDVRPPTMDLVGSATDAARSDHKHLINEILAEGETGELVAVFSTSDYLIKHFKKIGLWTDMTGASGATGDFDNSILHGGDVNYDDPGVLKPDAEEPLTGELSSGLALIGHVHPLNLVDAIFEREHKDDPTGHTGATGPLAKDYLKRDGSATGASGHLGGFGALPYYARIDHSHPLNFAEIANAGPSGFTGATGDYVKPIGGEAEFGVLPYYARVDHVHPDNAKVFTIKRVNEGSASSPNWRTIVYIPSWAIQTNYPHTSELVAVSGKTDWYYADGYGNITDICLHVKQVFDPNAQTDTCKVYYKLGSASQEGSWHPSTTGVYSIVKLGKVDTSTQKCVNYIDRPVFIDGDYFRARLEDEKGGGGQTGTVVTMNDTRQDTTRPGIVGLVGQGASGLALTAFDATDMEAVATSAFGGGATTLLDYLEGFVEVTTTSRSGAVTKLGKNINTENFEDECLEQSYNRPTTADLVGSATGAARSDHKHLINEILDYDEQGQPISVFSNVDALTNVFNKVGMWNDTSLSTGGTGWTDSTLLAFGDINFDYDDYLKPDGATGKAGTMGHGLVLSDHIHPLNVTGATGEVKAVGSASGQGETPTTGKQGTSNFYARVDHVHPLPSMPAIRKTGQDDVVKRVFVLDTDAPTWDSASYGYYWQGHGEKWTYDKYGTITSVENLGNHKLYLAD